MTGPVIRGRDAVASLPPASASQPASSSPGGRLWPT